MRRIDKVDAAVMTEPTYEPPAHVREPDPSAEKKISEGIDRAYQIYGPDLAAFFATVIAELLASERKPVQMDLPLAKSK